MAGARPLPLGFELIAHHAMEAMERRIGYLQAKRGAEPVLKLYIAGKPPGGRQACLELREHGRREGLLASGGARFFVGQ